MTTSIYDPWEDFKVEQFLRTLLDIMSMKVGEHLETWHLHLNQVLAAIRFNMNQQNSLLSIYYLIVIQSFQKIIFLDPKESILGKN